MVRLWTICTLALLSLGACKNLDKIEASNRLGEGTGGSNETETIESGSSREITLLTANPSAYDFGAVSLSSSSTKEIVLANAGDVAIEIGGIVLAGDVAYSQVNNCGDSLEVDETCTVTATFDPSNASVVNSLLIISYNSDSQKAVSLIGRGGSSLSFAGIDNVTNVGATTAQLNWTSATGGSVSAYQVQRLVGGNWNVIATLANTATYYVNTGLTPATSYSWRVYALDSFGVPDGNTKIATRSTNVVDFDPINPASLTIREELTRTITLSCNDSDGNTPSYSLLSVSDSDIGCSLSGGELECTPNNKAGHSNWTATVNLRCTIDGANIDYSPVFSVTNYSRPPVLTVPVDRNYPNHVHVGSSVTLNSTATDADGDTITYACEVRSTNLATSHPHYAAAGTNCDNLTAIQGTTAVFDEGSGALAWTTSGGQTANYEFQITATDTQGASDVETFNVSVGEPFSQEYAPMVELDTRFADGGTSDPLSSQVTTWTDLSGQDHHANIVGTGDNAGAHWLGTGGVGDPVYLSLDGDNDYLDLDIDNWSSNGQSHYIYFKIPSDAADGVHPVFSMAESFGVAVVKGAGENRLYWTSYVSDAQNGYGAVGSFEYDQWYLMRIWDEDGPNGTSNGRHWVSFGPVYDQQDIIPHTRWDPQTGVGEHSFYIGHKPSAVGRATGPLAQGTDLYGAIDILAIRTYAVNYTSIGGDWLAQRDFFLTERLKESPLGDTRLPSLTHIFDPAASKFSGYQPLDEGTECETSTAAGPSAGGVEDIAYSYWSYALSGVSNASCASDSTGWRGSGGAANPYRLAFDGVDDLLGSASYSYPSHQPFDPDTISNSFDIWVRVADGANTVVSNGFGPGIFLTYDSHYGGGDNRAILGVLDNGDGTSTLQLHFHNGSQTEDIKNTGAIVTNDTWNHIAVSAGPTGTVTLYLNGVAAYSSANLLTDFTFMEETACNSGGRRCFSMYLGGSTHSGAGDFRNGYFAGDIGLFRAYNGHGLTASQALFNCNHGKDRFAGASCGP